MLLGKIADHILISYLRDNSVRIVLLTRRSAIHFGAFWKLIVNAKALDSLDDVGYFVAFLL